MAAETKNNIDNDFAADELTRTIVSQLKQAVYFFVARYTNICVESLMNDKIDREHGRVPEIKTMEQKVMDELNTRVTNIIVGQHCRDYDLWTLSNEVAFRSCEEISFYLQEIIQDTVASIIATAGMPSNLKYCKLIARIRRSIHNKELKLITNQEINAWLDDEKNNFTQPFRDFYTLINDNRPDIDTGLLDLADYNIDRANSTNANSVYILQFALPLNKLLARSQIEESEFKFKNAKEAGLYKPRITALVNKLHEIALNSDQTNPITMFLHYVGKSKRFLFQRIYEHLKTDKAVNQNISNLYDVAAASYVVVKNDADYKQYDIFKHEALVAAIMDVHINKANGTNIDPCGEVKPGNPELGGAHAALTYIAHPELRRAQLAAAAAGTRRAAAEREGGSDFYCHHCDQVISHTVSSGKGGYFIRHTHKFELNKQITYFIGKSKLNASSVRGDCLLGHSRQGIPCIELKETKDKRDSGRA
jgi:hypothetical protein